MPESPRQDDVRTRLVTAASRLLAQEGPTALQARRLARAIDASTMSVYHHFGGMPQLLQAVSDDGFRRLDASLATVTVTGDPIADIIGLAHAYRAMARENPHLYDLMFGLAAPGGPRPSTDHETPDVRHPADAAYDHLVDAARRAITAGRIRRGDAAHVAAQLWSLLHGFVMLELAGHFAQFDDAATEVLLPMSGNLLVGLGDTAERLSVSAGRWLRSP